VKTKNTFAQINQKKKSIKNKINKNNNGSSFNERYAHVTVEEWLEVIFCVVHAMVI
jgi:hypothetical protein